jgi:uncharacterized membrane protein
MRLFLCSLVAMALSAGVMGLANADYIFTTIDVPGAIGGTYPTGINNAGQIVGAYLLGGDNAGTFLLSGGTYTSLNVPGADATGANGINNLGQIVGAYQVGNTLHGYILTGGNYTTIDVPGSSATRLYGINDAGQIIGGYTSGGTNYAFVMSGGNYTIISVPGSLFGTASWLHPRHPWWSASPLPLPPAPRSRSRFRSWIMDNASGQVAAGYTGTVTFSTSDPYPGVLPADYTFTPDDQGTHTFTGMT